MTFFGLSSNLAFWLTKKKIIDFGFVYHIPNIAAKMGIFFFNKKDKLFGHKQGWDFIAFANYDPIQIKIAESIINLFYVVQRTPNMKFYFTTF